MVLFSRFVKLTAIMLPRQFTQFVNIYATGWIAFFHANIGIMPD